MKIFKLFACLSKEELKLLRKAVISPLYNTNQKVVRLFEILRPLHPNFDDSIKTRKKISKKLFPKEAYNDYKLRWHFTELTKIIEQLLLFIGQEADEFERQKRLSEMYRQRNLYTQFTKENTGLLNQLKEIQTNFSNADFHLDKLKLLETAYFHPSCNKYDINDTMLEQALDSLDTYYILNKLRLTISLKSKERIQGKQYKYRFLDTIYEEIDQKFKEENQLLNLYQQAIKSIEEDGTFEFDKYEQYLFNHISFLDEANQKLFFFNGLNYLMRRYNKNLGSANKLLKWYQKGLSLNLLMDAGMMTEANFGNIAIVGANAKSFQWTKDFIEEFDFFLKEEIREEVSAYYKGMWYFYQNQLDEALNLLSQNKSLSEYTHRTKFFILRILFEKFLADNTYQHTLSSAIHAFKIFVNRDKYFKEDKFIPYLNLIKIIQKIIKKRISKESAINIKNWLANELKASEPIFAKQWLIQKIEEL